MEWNRYPVRFPLIWGFRDDSGCFNIHQKFGVSFHATSLGSEPTAEVEFKAEQDDAQGWGCPANAWGSLFVSLGWNMQNHNKMMSTVDSDL